MKGGAWQRASELLGTMGQARVERDTISYNSVISASDLTMGRDDIDRNTITYNTTTNPCMKGGEWQRALDLHSTVSREHNDVETRVNSDAISYSSAISPCVKGGAWQRGKT